MIKLTQDTRPDNAPPDFEKPETLGDVRAWSYSALKVYEECAYRTYISRVKGIKEVSGAAADRGTQIHQYAEDYVDGTMGEMHDSLFKFKDEFKELRELYAQAKVENETTYLRIDYPQLAYCKWILLLRSHQTSQRATLMPPLKPIGANRR